jgi:hypothetical protein
MVACLQTYLKRAPPPELQARGVADLDFERLLEMCRHHEVTPLVYRALKRSGFEAATLEPFRRDVEAETRWAFSFTQHTLALLRRFHDEGVPVLSHKGVVLSHFLFGDVALRPTKDIDIIVPLSAYPKAKACLTSLGYRGPLAYTGNLLDRAWKGFSLIGCTTSCTNTRKAASRSNSTGG